MFTWPSVSTATDGSVSKTDGVRGLVFEPAIVRVPVTSASYSVSSGEDVVATTVAQATTLTLPQVSEKNVGDIISIVKEVPGTDEVTIVPFGSELILGQTSVVLSFSYGTMKIYTNGTNWFALFWKIMNTNLL